MTVRPVGLAAVEAVECAELLEFIEGWLAGDGDYLAWSLDRFVGVAGYGVDELRADVAWFAGLLGGRRCSRRWRQLSVVVTGIDWLALGWGPGRRTRSWRIWSRGRSRRRRCVPTPTTW